MSVRSCFQSVTSTVDPSGASLVQDPAKPAPALIPSRFLRRKTLKAASSMRLSTRRPVHSQSAAAQRVSVLGLALRATANTEEGKTLLVDLRNHVDERSA